MAHVEGSGIDEVKVALSPDEVEVIVAMSPVESAPKFPSLFTANVSVAPARRLTVPLKGSDSPGVFVDSFAPGPVNVPL
jgi:hypothetical protein